MHARFVHYATLALVGVGVLMAAGSASAQIEFSENRFFDVGVGPSAVGLADVDGDGDLDMMLANNDNEDTTFNDTIAGVSLVLLNQGGGRFVLPPNGGLAAGANPLDLDVADFDGDGNVDYLVTNFDSNADSSVAGAGGAVTVFLGDGAGGFEQASGSPFQVGFSPEQAVIADFDGDGNPDVATSNEESDNISILLGDGTGSFAPAPESPVAAIRETSGIATGDLNNDEIPDIVADNCVEEEPGCDADFPGSSENALTVLLGDGDGTFSRAPSDGFVLGGIPFSPDIGDFNEDGNADVVVPAGAELRLLLGDGSGGLSAATASPFAISVARPRAVDINDDGHLDVVAQIFSSTSGANDSVVVLLGDGNGDLQVSGAPMFEVQETPLFSAFGTVDGDGETDIVVPNLVSDSVSGLFTDRLFANGFELEDTGTTKFLGPFDPKRDNAIQPGEIIGAH